MDGERAIQGRDLLRVILFTAPPPSSNHDDSRASNVLCGQNGSPSGTALGAGPGVLPQGIAWDVSTDQRVTRVARLLQRTAIFFLPCHSCLPSSTAVASLRRQPPSRAL